MRRRNCYCGKIAAANCTRCGSAACQGHLDEVTKAVYRLRPPMAAAYFAGDTLARASYLRGYSKATREVFVCRDCRDHDGKLHQAKVARQSSTWRQEPLMFAMTAAATGYVITEPGVTYDGAIQGWFALSWQPIEDIVIPRLVRPEKRREVRRGSYEVTRPARFANDRYRGWEFPNTAGVEGIMPVTDATVISWSAPTAILTDGSIILRHKESVVGPTYRLVVEMARKMFITRDALARWQGPPENWDT